MNGYKQVLNAHALITLHKNPSIPDFHLMVGSAEDLAPLPVLLYKETLVSPEIVKNMTQFDELSNEDIEKAIADNIIEVNDINLNIATLGSALGGF